jgi:23S rRNA A2030 N6-methylase RlmJ
MANAHFGNLADVFKHVALCEMLAAMRPAEYWESHAGAAYYVETSDVPAERQHGIHAFRALCGAQDALRQSAYGRTLDQFVKAAAVQNLPAQWPGSPTLARMLLGNDVRRLLFCDLDAESLTTISQRLAVGQGGGGNLTPDKLECVQDDGISILRGASMLLPEHWVSSTFVFIDPYAILEPTDGGISPLNLACELANRQMPTAVFYVFDDQSAREAVHQRMTEVLEKARLLKNGRAVRFSGALKTARGDGKPATQWGFGILALNVRPNAIEAEGTKLRALEAAYETAPLGNESGAWKLARADL